jgi:hypothetical protein
MLLVNAVHALALWRVLERVVLCHDANAQHHRQDSRGGSLVTDASMAGE